MTVRALPTGTVTFLFSDIEGSTRLAQALGTDSWTALLERHRDVVRAALAANGGTEVKTEGDGFFAVFPHASDAIAAAGAIQQALADEPWPEEARIRVRMGLHTGAGRLDADTDYVGADVHRAARIAAAAHGGQVVVSDVTRVLVEHDLPSGVSLRDLGEHRLKDIDRPEELHQIVVEGLPSDFPPLRSLGTIPTNLPSQLTTFLGREAEIAAISDLLGGTRMLTLTGPGGTGKTRLSIEVAGRVMDRFPDGVWFVPLGSISESELVAPTIAHELGLPDRGGRNPVDRLVDHLRGKRVLVVLDNFEQVVPAGQVVNELLTNCNELVVLVSSRSALHIYGEREYPVPPLGLPDPRRVTSVASLSSYEAVALFVERARAVRPDFAVTDDNAVAVAEICVRLDGLPLAIELAAARIKLLSPQAILARLDDRLSLLAGGARDLPARQQTLRGAIAWSHDMLEPPDRALFACASVFVGGGSLEAMKSVCGPELPETDVLDGLASLVDKSLVRQEEGLGGEPRFSMLGTIREFAVEQLAAGGADHCQRRHSAEYAAMAERTSTQVMGPDKRQILDLLEQEHDNLRAAINWATSTGRAETALRMCANLWRFWQMRGYLAEGRERTERALAMPHAADHPEARMAALEAAGGIAYWQGDGAAAQRWYAEALDLAREPGNDAAEAHALYNLSFAFIFSAGTPDVVQARTLAHRALEIYRRLGDRAGEGMALWAIANTYWGDARDGVTWEERDGATVYGSQALEIFRELSDTFMLGWAQYTLALNPVRFGNYEAARPRLAEALAIFAEANDVTGYVLVVDAIATLAARSGDPATAARLSGAVAELERRSGTGLNVSNRVIMDWEPAALRDDPATADAWASGTLLSVGQTVELAAEWLANPLPAAVKVPPAV